MTYSAPARQRKPTLWDSKIAVCRKLGLLSCDGENLRRRQAHGSGKPLNQSVQAQPMVAMAMGDSDTPQPPPLGVDPVGPEHPPGRCGLPRSQSRRILGGNCWTLNEDP